MVQQDLELLRDIPGYKAILKALIKSQIQYLVEQLSMHGDEESVLLTASITDGSLSHLGSESGKVFLDKHEDIRSQFLGFCLKREHTKAVSTAEPAASASSKDSYPPMSGPLRRRKSASKQHFSSTAAPYSNKTRHNVLHMPGITPPSAVVNYPNKPRLIINTSTPTSGIVTPVFNSSSSTADSSASNIAESLTQGHNAHGGDDNETNQNKHDEKVGIISSESVNFADSGVIESNALRTSDDSTTEHTEDTDQKDSCGADDGIEPSNIKIESVSSCDEDIVITGVEGGGAQHSGQMGEPTSWFPYAEQQSGNHSYDSAQKEETIVANLPKLLPRSSVNAQAPSSDVFPYQFLFDSTLQTDSVPQTYSSVGPRSAAAEVLPTVAGSAQLDSNAFLSFPESFFRASNDMHIEKIDGGRFRCLLCERVFNRKDYIRKHLLVHSGEKPFKCHLCPAAFRQKTHIRLHMSMKHSAGSNFEILNE